LPEAIRSNQRSKAFSREKDGLTEANYLTVSPTVLLLSTLRVVSPIIVPTVLVESPVGGGVVPITLLSALEVLSLPVPQAVQIPETATINSIFS